MDLGAALDLLGELEVQTTTVTSKPKAKVQVT